MTDVSETSKPKRKPGRPPKKSNHIEDITWITKKSDRAYVSIDKQQRLYVSSEARRMLNVPSGQFRLITGYDKVNKRIVLAKPEVVRVPDVKPFKFDKRAYSRVKEFVEQANLYGQLPVRFYYQGRDYANVDGSFAFQLEGTEAPDR